MLRNKKIKYLLVGACNTFFGYFLALLIYESFNSILHIIVIGIITNILNISISFFMYKFFVFKSNDYWLYEYLRSYIVYGSAIFFSLFALWITVDFLNIRFWLAQALVTLITICISYLGHNRITFKVK